MPKGQQFAPDWVHENCPRQQQLHQRPPPQLQRPPAPLINQISIKSPLVWPLKGIQQSLLRSGCTHTLTSSLRGLAGPLVTCHWTGHVSDVADPAALPFAWLVSLIGCKRKTRVLKLMRSLSPYLSTNASKKAWTCTEALSHDVQL